MVKISILHIDLKKAEGAKTAQFRFFWDNPNKDKRRTLLLSDIAELTKLANTNYYSITQPADYAQMGQKLFNWLDGSDRLLESTLKAGTRLGPRHGELFVLALAASGGLANLPWELLHDGTKYLIESRIVPVRWVKGNNKCLNIQKAEKNRCLNLAFMATSPQGVEPPLKFEEEEGRIIEATQKKQSLSLTVEESGNLEELSELLLEYEGDSDREFDVIHLTGHTSIVDNTPYFLTETEFGDRQDSSTEYINNSLQFSSYKLLFLSGCRTGFSPDKDNAIPSMAEALLHQGARPVLSWGYYVGDEKALVAAERFYQELSMGRTVTEALVQTYQALLKLEREQKGTIKGLGDKVGSQWHLLRLYVADSLPGALVTSLGTESRKFPTSSQNVGYQLIGDKDENVRLLPRSQFVGRRRQLQNCLRVLKTDWEKVGVLIQGMGGWGKSALAARLCDRLSKLNYEILVWQHQRQIDESDFTSTLAKQLSTEHRQILLESPDTLKYRLRQVFADLHKTGKAPFIFFFDNFEFNLELRDDRWILQTDAAHVLNSLIEAMREPDSRRHRLIITCRYQFSFGENSTLFSVQVLKEFNPNEIWRKLKHLDKFSENRTGKILIDRALKLADGNPRLLEWLNTDVLSQDNAKELLTKYEKNPSQWLDRIIWNLEHEPALRIDEPLAKSFGLFLVYEIYVPREALEVVCEGRSPEEKEKLINRAIDLGLMGVTPEVKQSDRTYRFSRILPSIQLPPEPEVYPLYRKAWEELSKLWGNIENHKKEQWREIFRLKLADKTNPQRFREGFKQMLSVQFDPLHEESDRAFEAELRKEKDQLDRATLFEHLEALLQQEKWIEADVETAWIFYQIMVREGFKDFYDLCKKFPVRELNEIDALWVKYSQGQFGFSVQAKIYKSVGGTDEWDYDTWQKFGEQVKWYEEKWKKLEDIYQEVEAPVRSQAPLVPAMWTTRGGIWVTTGLVGWHRSWHGLWRASLLSHLFSRISRISSLASLASLLSHHELTHKI